MTEAFPAVGINSSKLIRKPFSCWKRGKIANIRNLRSKARPHTATALTLPEHRDLQDQQMGVTPRDSLTGGLHLLPWPQQWGTQSLWKQH